MMALPFLDIPPLDGAAGTVRLPGSKSISNRVLLLSGLARGETVVDEVLSSDDTQVMLQALQQLGCSVTPQGRSVRIGGLGGQLRVRQADLFLGNAGTAMRPLTAALAVLSAQQGGSFVLRGVARMHERPIADLVEALRQLGCGVEALQQEGYPPLRVHGPVASPLNVQTPIRVRGDVSSQFLSALLLAMPLLSDHSDVSVEVVGELISKPYVDITLNLLQRFGVSVVRQGYERFVVPRGSTYQSPGRIAVEGDASSASYFIAMGSLAAPPSDPVRIEGVGRDSIQGDIRFVEAAAAMGANITLHAHHIEVSRGAWPLQAVQMDCNHIPDAAMTLAVMALFAQGTTRLTNIGSWRVKETDRIAAMACELRKLGASVAEHADAIDITPPQHWQAATLATYDDHRMAMCASLAAFNGLLGARAPVRVLQPGCVGKTYPDYFQDFFRLASAPVAHIPVITVDGPSASGKGTLAAALAQRLGYAQLDSGALYRLTGLAAWRQGVALDDEAACAQVARDLQLRFEGERVWLGEEDVSVELRHEQTGTWASQVAALPGVRRALHQLQLDFRRLPGLVGDGRDLGTVIFPDAALKVFLTASAAQRALRRHKQLISKGIQARIEDLQADLEARDARDKSRSVAPLVPAEDALLLDNSHLSIEESVDQVLQWWAQRRPFAVTT